jgi:hypothetical protein
MQPQRLRGALREISMWSYWLVLVSPTLAVIAAAIWGLWWFFWWLFS